MTTPPATGPAPSGQDISAFANRLRKNLAHWGKWARRRGIACFRIYDRDVPQFPFAIDWYETITPHTAAHLHVQEVDTGWAMSDEEHAAWLAAVCAAIVEVCALPAANLHLKHRQRQRGAAQYEKLSEKPGPAARTFVVEEAGHRLEINLDAYLDTGLFLDHRPMRALVADAIALRAASGRGSRFLNLFAYTGSFTVYAARAGASRSTTVDLSNTYQGWTARNLALNGIDAARHLLVRADVMAWLSEAAERYDVIVLDPPSFSNSKKMQGVLDVQRDHAWLLERCHGLLAPGGELFFSTNLRSFAMDAQLAQRLALREITSRSVPEDFRRPSRQPPHRAWLTQKAG
jgi:23S rRNA (cytosine1962-C5)-methyltransferase